ncbi:MAG: DUF4058 family protein [Planctomycetota bacterium]
MPSPFPGMDPYLEGPLLWEDFHHELASVVRRQLTPLLRPRYVAALEPRVVYDELVIERAKWVKPDVGVYDTGQTRPGGDAAGPAVMTQPVVATAVVEDAVHEQRVAIQEVTTGDLVTAIEILSPVNKRPGHEAHDDYHRKRRALLRTNVHLMEIDLLRAGQRAPRLVTPLPESPYFVFLVRGSDRSAVEIWPVSFRQPLPVVSVPLRPPDPDVALDLDLALRTAYDDAGYDLRIDYDTPPPAPDLSREDAAWLAARIAATRGSR